MNDFPRMLFKCPGAEPMHGGHFSTIIVGSQDAQEEALSAGWQLSTPEAVQAHAVKPVPQPPAEVADDVPPTRAELEQKAKSLGINFDGRISDKKLGALIQAAI